MKEVGLYEAKTRLSALVAEVETTGQAIALTKHGRIVAEITPPKAAVSPMRGMLKSVDFSISSDFDDDSSPFDGLFEDLESDQAEGRIKVAEEPTEYPAPKQS